MIAHTTLEVREAPAGSYHKAVFSVPHGCSGSPTVAVRVRIPDGVFSVKPQPKPGWTLDIVRDRLTTPVAGPHGAAITETVREIAWRGGRLLDEHFDEFKITLKLPEAPGTTVYFPVVQECEQGVHRWIEIPEAGRSAADLKEPAPSVALTAAR